jgi:hypothetical protein
MADYDPSNQNTVAPAKLVQSGGKPTIAELKAAIAGSAVTAKYPAKWMFSATKNDLVYACRTEGIAVAGLPGV